MVSAEDLVSEEGAPAREGRGRLGRDLRGEGRRRERDGLAGERPEEDVQLLQLDRLVEGEAHRAVGIGAEVDAFRERARDHGSAAPGGRAEPDPQGVEEGRRARIAAEPPQAGGEDGGERVDASRDADEPLGPVVDRVHRGHHRQQDLGRADVAGGLVAADVLLAGLEGEPVGRPPLSVLRHPDEAAGDVPTELVAGGHEGGVRTAEAQGHPEALARADRDVGAPLSGRSQEGEGEQIGGHGDDGPRRMRLVHERRVVFDAPVGGRILEEQAEEPLAGEVGLGRLAHPHCDAPRLRAGPDHRDGLRVAIVGHEEGAAPVLVQGMGHVHGLGRGRGLVEQGGVGQGQRAEVGHQGLEVDEGLQPPLRDLGLIRGVLRVPAGVLQHVALDDGRSDAVVVAHAEEGPQDAVLGGHGPQGQKGVLLAERRGQIERTFEPDAARHRLSHEGVEGRGPHDLEHRGDVGLPEPEVTRGESVRGREERRGSARAVRHLPSLVA
jgi:hypothetical protein